MRFSHFFIDRPIFAAVLSILLTIAGAIAQRSLPISEYPEIAPPTVNISARYPGASAEVIAATVATPIEQEVNGVDDMLYITSQSTGDGKVSIDVVSRRRGFWSEVQRVYENRIRTSLPSSLSIAWNGVLKPRHFLGVRLAVRTMSWISSSDTLSISI